MSTHPKSVRVTVAFVRVGGSVHYKACLRVSSNPVTSSGKSDLKKIAGRKHAHTKLHF